MELTSEYIIESLYLIRSVTFYNGMVFAILYVFSDKANSITQSLEHIRRVLSRTTVAITALRGVVKEVQTTLTSTTGVSEIIDIDND